MGNNGSKQSLTLQEIIRQGMEDKVIKKITLPNGFDEKLVKKRKELRAVTDKNEQNRISLKELALLKENVENVNDLIANDFQSLKYTTLKLSKYLRDDVSDEIRDLRDIINECNKEYKAVRETLDSIKEIVKLNDESKNKEDIKEINHNLSTLVRQNKKLINLTTKMQEENFNFDDFIAKTFEKWAKNHIRGFALK